MDQSRLNATLKGYAGRRVLVTGHTGFKGGWLAFLLHRLGAEVTGLALAPGEPSLFAALGLDGIVNHRVGDIRDPKAMADAFAAARPEFVFHLAAKALVRPSYDDPKATFDTNVGGSVNLLEAVRATPGVRSLVYVTSDKCYRNKGWHWGYRENDELGGRDPYSASKAAAEVVFQSYLESFLAAANIGAASVRAGNVIGGGDWAPDRILPDAVRALSQGQPIPVRNPGAVRPWQHVLDPVCGYLLLGLNLAEEPSRYSGAWNFGPPTGRTMSAIELAEGAVDRWGSGSIRDASDPSAPHEEPYLQLCCDKALRLLDWRGAWDAGAALDAAVAWYKAVLAGQPAAEVTARQINDYLGGDE